MKVRIWLIYKKDDPRIYTRTTQPSDEQVARWRADGFKVYRGDLLLPVMDDTSVDGVLEPICVD